MTAHKIGTREEWLAARKALLAREKALTRDGDALARERRELPWVRVEKTYRFDTTHGVKTLRELFDGRSQLLVYHFMLGPLTPKGCPGCSFHADHFDGALAHLEHHDVTFVCASRAPLATLNAYKARMGWKFPWVSSGESGDFNFDFAFYGEEGRRTLRGYNFDTPKRANLDFRTGEEVMAFSCFALEDGVVYHTYSCFDRGTEAFNPTWQLLDRAPKGREEANHPRWPRKHDEYDVQGAETWSDRT
jgi:predicted dithiol-disulfide oxidoreductase (DUF899 family)